MATKKNSGYIPVMEQNRNTTQQAVANYAKPTTAPSVQSTPTPSVQNTQPQNTTASGMSVPTSTPSYSTSTVNNGDVAVRQALVNMGLDNSKIGFSDNSVTYDGKSVLNPSSVVDGTSYASNNDAYQAGVKAYQNEGTNLSSATNYFATKGLPYAAEDLGNGMLSIGGIIVSPLFVSNGKAVYKTEVLDNAYSKIQQDTGLKSNQQVVDDWQNKYGKVAQDYVNDNILNYSYDPESDPVYVAARAAAQRDGERSYKNSVGESAAMNGGYATSAGIAAAQQSQNNYNQQFSDNMADYATSDYSRKIQSLNALTGVGNDYYNKDYTAARDTRSDLIDSYKSDYDRDVAQVQNGLQNTINEQSIALNEDKLKQSAIDTNLYEQNAQEDLQTKEYANTYQNLINQGYSNQEIYNQMIRANQIAQVKGSYDDTTAAALGIIKNADGSYPSPYEGDLAKAEQTFNRITKQQLSYENTLAQQLDTAQTTNQIRANAASTLANQKSQEGLLDYQNRIDQENAQNGSNKLSSTGSQYYSQAKNFMNNEGYSKSQVWDWLSDSGLSNSDLAIITGLLDITSDDINGTENSGSSSSPWSSYLK